MVSTLVSRNVTVDGRRTSVRLEPAMWDALAEVCERENMTIHELVTDINRARQESSLTAAIRVHLLMYYRNIAMDGAALGSASGSRRPGRPRDGVPMRRATR